MFKKIISPLIALCIALLPQISQASTTSQLNFNFSGGNNDVLFKGVFSGTDVDGDGWITQTHNAGSSPDVLSQLWISLVAYRSYVFCRDPLDGNTCVDVARGWYISKDGFFSGKNSSYLNDISIWGVSVKVDLSEVYFAFDSPGDFYVKLEDDVGIFQTRLATRYELFTDYTASVSYSVVPLPASAFLMLSAILGLFGVRRIRTTAKGQNS